MSRVLAASAVLLTASCGAQPTPLGAPIVVSAPSAAPTSSSVAAVEPQATAIEPPRLRIVFPPCDLPAEPVNESPVAGSKKRCLAKLSPLPTDFGPMSRVAGWAEAEVALRPEAALGSAPPEPGDPPARPAEEEQARDTLCSMCCGAGPWPVVVGVETQTFGVVRAAGEGLEILPLITRDNRMAGRCSDDASASFSTVPEQDIWVVKRTRFLAEEELVELEKGHMVRCKGGPTPCQSACKPQIVEDETVIIDAKSGSSLFAVQIQPGPETLVPVGVDVSAAGIRVHGGGCEGPSWTWAEARKLGAMKPKPKPSNARPKARASGRAGGSVGH